MKAPGQISPAFSLADTGPADARVLARLHGKIFPEPWSQTFFQRLLAENGTQGLTATMPGVKAPAGFAIIRFAADEVEILTLGVNPPDRRHGVGRALVGEIAASASAHGCARIFLEVAQTNMAARNLYERTGYKPAGRRAGYYRRHGGPAIDAIILSYDLKLSCPDSI